MARIGRFAGSLLIATQEGWFLVGNPKEPCEWVQENLPPPYLLAVPESAERLRPPLLIVDGEGEPIARAIGDRLLIDRNGLVSERLWRILLHGQEGAAEIRCEWLTKIPAHVWQVVRDSMLKCS